MIVRELIEQLAAYDPCALVLAEAAEAEERYTHVTVQTLRVIDTGPDKEGAWWSGRFEAASRAYSTEVRTPNLPAVVVGRDWRQ